MIWYYHWRFRFTKKNKRTNDEKDHRYQIRMFFIKEVQPCLEEISQKTNDSNNIVKVSDNENVTFNFKS